MDGAVRTGAVCCLSVALRMMGCQSSAQRRPASAKCAEIEPGITLSQSVTALNQLPDAFARQCHHTVIEYGTSALAEFRQKTFHVIAETFSVFLPDGTLTDYVLETDERGFRSLLLAASYARQQQYDDAKVELRRLDHELSAPLDNYGEDPVNLLLSAVFREQLGEQGEARVDWLRLRDIGGLPTPPDTIVRAFADRQIRRLDEGRPQRPLRHVYGLRRFPAVQWDLPFASSNKGYVLITATEPFPAACASETGVRILTRSWLETIAPQRRPPSTAHHAEQDQVALRDYLQLRAGRRGRRDRRRGLHARRALKGAWCPVRSLDPGRPRAHGHSSQSVHMGARARPSALGTAADRIPCDRVADARPGTIRIRRTDSHSVGTAHGAGKGPPP